MKIKLASVSIDDYDKALKFYTEVLGFTAKRDIPWEMARVGSPWFHPRNPMAWNYSLNRMPVIPP